MSGRIVSAKYNTASSLGCQSIDPVKTRRAGRSRPAAGLKYVVSTPVESRACARASRARTTVGDPVRTRRSSGPQPAQAAASRARSFRHSTSRSARRSGDGSIALNRFQIRYSTLCSNSTTGTGPPSGTFAAANRKSATQTSTPPFRDHLVDLLAHLFDSPFPQVDRIPGPATIVRRPAENFRSPRLGTT